MPSIDKIERFNNACLFISGPSGNLGPGVSEWIRVWPDEWMQWCWECRLSEKTGGFLYAGVENAQMKRYLRDQRTASLLPSENKTTEKISEKQIDEMTQKKAVW